MKFKVMLFALAMSALMCAPSFAGILDRGCTVCGEVVDDCGVCEACDACDSCDTRSCDLFGGLRSLFPGRGCDTGCDPCGEIAVEVCEEVAVDPCEAVADCGACGACDDCCGRRPKITLPKLRRPLCGGCGDCGVCDEVAVDDCGVCDEIIADDCGVLGACDDGCGRRALITLPKIELPTLRRPLCGDCGACDEVAVDDCGVCDEIIADDCGVCGDGCDTGRRVRMPRLGLIDMLDGLLCGTECGDCGVCDECGVCDDVPVCGGCGAPVALEAEVVTEAVPQVLPVSP